MITIKWEGSPRDKATESFHLHVWKNVRNIVRSSLEKKRSKSFIYYAVDNLMILVINVSSVDETPEFLTDD